jgi:two-component system LytT family response regulator
VIHVLIADDELPARQRLRQLLLAHPEFEVIAEAEDGTQAMELVASTSPDLLLLDIQMPYGNGLDIAACLPSPRPAIIFCTAFDEHAVDAFELNALDYLLKPVSRVRLEKALARVISNQAKNTDSSLEHMLRDPQQRLTRFLVRNGARYVVVSADETAFFESTDGLTRVMTEAGKQYWMDAPLNDLEERVDPQRFFRISRAALVNISSIAEVHPLPGGGAAILLKNGMELDVSRRRVRDLLKAIECS